LPKDLCVCETIVREGQKLEVKTSRRRFGKLMTVISGFSKDVDVVALAKKLKTRMACGGTAKEKTVELQGDHRKRIKKELVKLGFPESQIEVK
jgi:translation initiation factor 1